MEAVTHEEAAGLLASHDLITVGARGDDVRRRVHGVQTTFVRVFEVHVDAPPSTLPAKLAAGEIRIVGRPASVRAAADAVRAVAGLAGRVPVTGFSLPDLVDAAAREGMPFAEACGLLHDAGLYAIAEVVLGDSLDPSPVANARNAGLAVTRLTVHAYSGHDGLATIERARNLQSEIGGFQVFAPLPRVIDVAQPTTGYDDVKHVALARLVCEHIPSIQVDWQLYGPKLAQVALTVGADDVDGIAAVDTGALGTRRSPIEEIRGNIRAAGLEPVERDARFERLA